MLSRVRGVEDILDVSLVQFLKERARTHLACYNFSEIETPHLEHLELFKRSLGLETDVVTKEMYTFQTQSGESICLRPEATAGVMRAFLENGIQNKPWKVFTIGPMFRHERPQKGRWRQFQQINMEVIGSASIAEDAHSIKMLDRFFSEVLGLDTYALKINFLGDNNDRARYKKTLGAFLDKNRATLCTTCKVRREKNIMRVLDCKQEACATLYLNAPTIIDTLSKDSNTEWSTLTETLKLLSVTHTVDHKLVRGLDYYNKTVFEFSSPLLGAQDAFCGGGRYDGLAEQLGSKERIPSLGAAIGIGRLLLLLTNRKDILTIQQKQPLSVIIPVEKKQQQLALLLACHLQEKDYCVDVILTEGSMKSMMRKANKLGAAYVLILGETEQQNGTVVVKNMQSGESIVLAQDAVAKQLS